MFTGLIQAIGQVRSLEGGSESGRLRIASALVHEDLCLGESIAVNGVCLTVTSWDRDSFTLDVSPETLRTTTLGGLSPRTAVNLERALRMCDRLGGHLVAGHVDSVGTVRQMRKEHNSVYFEFAVGAESLRYIVAKGSVAIDGVSLTVNQVFSDRFSIMVIPHSFEQTCLKERRVGDAVNIETDLIGRYVERFVASPSGATGGSLSREFLAKNGFV
ncbi:riboflavin synthase [Pelovirga terrestris]|uniref:Riboflavin synthase n=1 Tax=Pelovirga terrestris TaxID=2771352 RepID=A0A8J6QW67_9BACT|nr:riboflavin synthase [Pelovirga terrestris]MBD1399606.1 riboflavin synthase [Pelovirga terrestris]